MSWFSELTSKAEAMLIKLDQNAAHALQNPDGLIRGNKLIDQAISTITTISSDNNSATSIQDSFEGPIDNLKSIDNKSNDNITASLHFNKGNNFEQEETNYLVQDEQFQGEGIQDSYPRSKHAEHLVPQLPNHIVPQHGTDYNGRESVYSATTPQSNPSQIQTNPTISFDQSQTNPETRSKRHAKKFVIQTGRTKIFNPKNEQRNNEPQQINQTTPSSSSALHTVDDIRSSIRKTLQEYVNESPYQNNTETSYSSHFDSQPNMMGNSREHYDPHTSASFNIDLPDNDDYGGSSNGIAMKLLQESAKKRKSSFYIHKVINKLADPTGRYNSIVSGEIKIKMRRIQMRAGSYVRRLNYYYKTNPMMKYMMIVYLILMQLLVVYVLFFYHSTPSNNDLSTQINKQQQALDNS